MYSLLWSCNVLVLLRTTRERGDIMLYFFFNLKFCLHYTTMLTVHVNNRVSTQKQLKKNIYRLLNNPPFYIIVFEICLKLFVFWMFACLVIRFIFYSLFKCLVIIVFGCFGRYVFVYKTLVDCFVKKILFNHNKGSAP